MDMSGAFASDAPLPNKYPDSILTGICPGTVSICPHKRILGLPLPLVAITLPTLSILTFSNPRSSKHFSLIKLANCASDLDGVYISRAFFNNSIAYAEEINFANYLFEFTR